MGETNERYYVEENNGEICEDIEGSTIYYDECKVVDLLNAKDRRIAILEAPYWCAKCDKPIRDACQCHADARIAVLEAENQKRLGKNQ